MPSTSPGNAVPSEVAQLLPGAPTSGPQSIITFTYSWKRYIAYISGAQLSILSDPKILTQAITFPDELVAIASEVGKTGKLAVASKSDVWVLEPETQGSETVRWEKVLLLRREDAVDEARTLSWGNENGEILIGGSHTLSLFSTLPSSRTSSPATSPVDGEDIEERTALWSKAVSSPVSYATFCPSANLIASCGARDRLVKIWRRLSFEEGLFDYAYLPHPSAVTHLEWRPLDEQVEERRGSGLSRRSEEDAEVLYTIASDGVLRVWRAGGLHDLEILMLHTTVDLVSSIPSSPSMGTRGKSRPPKPPRYTLILPSQDFCAAVAFILGQTAPNQKSSATNHSLEHLREVSSKSPDVVVTLDGHGRMSAWGLQSVGHKRRPETPGSNLPFHICHCEDLGLKVPEGTNARFRLWLEDDKLNLLCHTFDGKLDWWSGDVGTFFATSTSGNERLKLSTSFTGHAAPVIGMTSAGEGSSLLSWSGDGQVVAWNQSTEGTLERQQVYNVGCKVRQAASLSPADGTLVLSSEKVVLVGGEGQVVATASHGLGCSFHLIRIDSDTRKVDQSAAEAAQHWLLLGDDGRASKLTITADAKMTCSPPYPLCKINGRREMCLHLRLVPHPHTQASRRIISVNGDGVLSVREIAVEALATPSTSELSDNGKNIQTGSRTTRFLEAFGDFAALASQDGKTLVIVELVNGYVELQRSYEQPIRRLSFFAGGAGASSSLTMLAVAFAETVEVLVPKQYERHCELPNWVSVKHVSVTGSGLEIKTVQWVADRKLALAAGNGLMVTEHTTNAEDLHPELRDRFDHTSEETLNLAHITERLNRPLPVWHPRFLSRLARHGRLGAVFHVLKCMEQRLKFWSEGEYLSATFDLDTLELISSDYQHAHHDLDSGTWVSLTDLLDEKDLPGISRTEQKRLKRVIEALQSVQEHVDALDDNAMRYLLNWKVQILYMTAERDAAQGGKPNGRLTNGISHTEHQDVPVMSWREIAFAHHSTTQQPLLDILIAHYDNKLTWPIASNLGITTWIREIKAPQTEGSANASLEQILDTIAQSAYRSSSPPDPVNGSLFFLALRQKARLLALWRIATWHREQRSTTNFLKRDFSQPAAQTAAKKNAYALMGKRRFAYAAAFFLLAEDAQSAVSVLAMQCHDANLAIAVARMYAGDGSACLIRLLEDRIMPKARGEGDRWCLSWCHSVMGQKDDAAYALIRPIEDVQADGEDSKPQLRRWEQDDPATLLLYSNIRTSSSSSTQEYKAVLRAAGVLRRMGLMLIALELVSQWKFAQPIQQTIAPTAAATAAQPAKTSGTPNEPPSMLNDFTSLAVQAPARSETNSPSILTGFATPEPVKAAESAPVDEQTERQKKAAELMARLKAKKEQSTTTAKAVFNEKKPEPTQFKEPEANSLLDSFGF